VLEKKHLRPCRESNPDSLTLANDQLDAQIFKYIYYNPLHVHVSSNILLILRRSNCINTVILDNSLVSRLTIPDAVLIQFDLLRMSKILLETCTRIGL
jgi:hypothetical protein